MRGQLGEIEQSSAGGALAVYVYSLSDPRSGEVRYVGRTINPKRRLVLHCTKPSTRPCARTWPWIAELRALGLRPVLSVLACLSSHEEAAAAEVEAIALRRRQGHALLNATKGGERPGGPTRRMHQSPGRPRPKAPQPRLKAPERPTNPARRVRRIGRAVGIKDRSGQRVGQLTVLERDTAVLGKKGVYWLCRCDCGATASVRTSNLPRTKSCGCYRSIRPRTHGKSSTTEYTVWRHMLRRCHNPTDSAYPAYGGRGISVDPRWHSFPAFIADVGPRPSPRYSLHRLDNDGDYAPGNVIWASRYEQARNKRSNRIIAYGGRSLTLTQWSLELGSGRRVLGERLNKLGWSVERAFGTPTRLRRARLS